MRITVLMHRHDPPIEAYGSAGLVDAWRQQGHQVEVTHGLSEPVRGDVVLLHIDLTIVPPEYAEAVADHPCVINRRVLNTSKTLISRNLVRSPDEWDGPVIVKTVLNHGGHPERLVRRASPFGRVRNVIGKLSRLSLGVAESLNPHHYPIFSSARDVPRAAYRNSHLVVERFLPEYRDGLYYMRMCCFLGDRWICEVCTSPDPVVKGPKTMLEQVPVHDEILVEREKLGLDYGKIDYVLHEGQPVLLDVNRTPGVAANAGRARRHVEALAPGIDSFLR